MIVVVPANSRFRSWAELLAELKAAPDTICVGQAGNGTPNHTDILRLQENEKVSFNIVPYRGSGVGLNDVLAGQIKAYVDQLSSSLPHLQAGKLRALVVVGDKRVPELPNVQSLAEVAEGDRRFAERRHRRCFERARGAPEIHRARRHRAPIDARGVRCLSEDRRGRAGRPRGQGPA